METENIENIENIENVENLETSTYPEGFDAELYNLETHSLREDKVREVLDNNKKIIEDLEK